MGGQKRVSRLADILPQAMRSMKKGQAHLTKEEIEGVWTKVAGPQAAQHSWPHRMTKKRLIIEVESSGWMYTLNLKRQQLLVGLIELLGADRVTALNFRIGEKKDA
ncbi:MAG: DUF721 domain-containing protein [Candidatus Omnitrophica bacterium]|nr:DUF721 domain-containing protein [Candidatus Omnitrophota bacterium]